MSSRSLCRQLTLSSPLTRPQHLSKKTKTIITLVVLVLLVAAGGFVAWKWGTELYDDAHDFMIFPTVTTRAFRTCSSICRERKPRCPRQADLACEPQPST